MGKISQLFFNWGPAVCWMIVIFILSSRQRMTLAPEYLVNFLIFKTLHMIEYAILYFLLFRGFFLSRRSGKVDRNTFLTPFIIAILYAISDEIHQTFVPTREGAIRDVFIDSLGIFFMYTFIKSRIKIIRKIFNS